MIEDLKPDGWDDTFRTFAEKTRPIRCYTQGMFGGTVAVWIEIDGLKTLIGYGDYPTAKAEATARMLDLIEQMQSGLDLHRATTDRDDARRKRSAVLQDRYRDQLQASQIPKPE